MKTRPPIVSLLAVLVLLPAVVFGQTYSGTENCRNCHNNSFGGFQYTHWEQTLHSKIHLKPDTVSIRPLASFTNGDSLSMGSSYGNAMVYMSRVGGDYFARIGAGGATYKIAYTYGWGFKQRYLVKIDTSYYILPIQFNLKGYLDNSTGTWATYNPNKWFTAAGTPLDPATNSFRKNSWDKNCAGCHVTGGKVETVVSGADTSWRASWAAGTDLNIVVGCETCHGPYQGGAGIGHQMNPAKLGSKDAKMEVCGQCHNRASSWRGAGLVGTHEYPKNEIDGTYFNPADTNHPLVEFMNLDTPPNTPGGPGTWYDSATARQHHQQYQEMLGSKHYTNPFVEMNCFTCHAGHGPALRDHNMRDSLVVDGEGFEVENDDNTLCLSCHATHGPFADVQKAWVHDPVTYKDSIGAVVNLHTKHGTYDPENDNSTGGIGRCSKCHMTKTATTARAYDISTHTFRVVPPIATKKYSGLTSPTSGMLNSCASACHRNPSGSTANVPSFGISDGNLANWAEATDLELADSLWYYWLSWGFTGVKEVADVVPKAYHLGQNYPNPFNPTTTIVVDLPASGDVRMAIYDVNGREVATLMEGFQELGRYEVTWNGLTNLGFPATSGVYFYALEAKDFRQTRKMVMIR